MMMVVVVVVVTMMMMMMMMMTTMPALGSYCQLRVLRLRTKPNRVSGKANNQQYGK